MRRFGYTPPEERTDDPFTAITPEDIAKNVGKCVAVDPHGGGIIESAETISALRLLMAEKHPEIEDYNTLPIPDLSGLAKEIEESN